MWRSLEGSSLVEVSLGEPSLERPQARQVLVGLLGELQWRELPDRVWT